jgi:hypothetical protein
MRRGFVWWQIRAILVDIWIDWSKITGQFFDLYKPNSWRPYFDIKSAKCRPDLVASGRIRKSEVRWTNPYMKHLEEIFILTDLLRNESELERNFMLFEVHYKYSGPVTPNEKPWRRSLILELRESFVRATRWYTQFPSTLLAKKILKVNTIRDTILRSTINIRAL